jgi:acyl-CoA synthetase (AMP-forming)/AMP-acid ligase II
VVEAAVVGLPDEVWGERVHAVVSGRAEIDPEALLAHARAHLARHKCPKAIEVWPNLPKSGANKILRRTVRDRVIAAQGGQS